MKLIHAADLHLDSPMVGLGRYDGAPVDEIKGATRKALANLVDAAMDHEVDAVLLAGDLFDGNWTHYGTGVHFIKEMGRLREAGIPVVSISGNHDAESKITKELGFPDNVHVLDVAEPETFVLENVGLAVHGQGYAAAAITDDLSLAYPGPLADLVNVGLLHTAVGGRRGHANYAPCKLAFLQEHGYDYWGLGHSHGFEILSEDPPVVFSGNLQGRGIHERGPKGAVLVEVGPDGVDVDRLSLDVVRWEIVELDVGKAATFDDLAGLARTGMRAAANEAGDRLLAARIVFSGEGEIHNDLLADPERLRHEMYGAAVDVAGDQLWVEEVRVETSPPGAAPTAGSDAVGELLAELEDISADDVAIAEIATELDSLAEVLPPSLAAELAPNEPRFVAGVLRNLSASLPAELMRGERS
jgi:DNA repair exonuclease SbcCD nuclease subunit